MQYKLVAALALIASASAFAPSPAFTRQSTAVYNGKADWGNAAELGWSMGGEDYTRDVTPKEDKDDPRKSIHQGESFEEYMKNRAAGGGF